MGMTIAEKILAKHSGRDKVEPGEVVDARIDLAMIHDVLGLRIIRILEECCVKDVWDPDKVVAIIDHWFPAPTIDIDRSSIAIDHPVPNSEYLRQILNDTVFFM